MDDNYTMAINMEDKTGQGSKYLFHYTTAAGLGGILHSGDLRFSRSDRLNDPRERKPFEFGYNEAMIPGGISAAQREQLTSNVREIFHHAKVACFTEEGSETSGDAFYTRGWSRARAWAQYGEDHRGACLIFDRERLVANAEATVNDEVFSMSVKYQDRQSLDWSDETPVVLTTDPIKQTEQLLGYRNRHMGQLFFEKNLDWASEREFRILTFTDQCVNVHIQDSLVAIVLGEEYPEEEKAVLGHRVVQAGINELQICYMQWMNGAPGTGRISASDLPGLRDAPQPSDGTSPTLIPDL